MLDSLIYGLIGASIGSAGAMLIRWFYYGRYLQPLPEPMLREALSGLVKSATGVTAGNLWPELHSGYPNDTPSPGPMQEG